MSNQLISHKILTGKEAIKIYIGNISDHLFDKYIRAGMPARYEDKRWIAHTDNIDEFFRKHTFVSMGKVLEQIKQDEED